VMRILMSVRLLFTRTWHISYDIHILECCTRPSLFCLLSVVSASSLGANQLKVIDKDLRSFGMQL
jgi:hypothetical protein